MSELSTACPTERQKETKTGDFARGRRIGTRREGFVERGRAGRGEKRRVGGRRSGDGRWRRFSGEASPRIDERKPESREARIRERERESDQDRLGGKREKGCFSDFLATFMRRRFSSRSTRDRCALRPFGSLVSFCSEQKEKEKKRKEEEKKNKNKKRKEVRIDRLGTRPSPFTRRRSP